MAEIRLDGITKIYDRRVRAVDGVDLTIDDGEFMVLLGPSGCGKTTLLRTIAGLEYPEAGSVVVGGRDITNLPPRKRGLAMVFQSYAVFPHLRVYDNIAFGLRMSGTGRAEVRRRVERAAELVQLGEFLDRYPAKLSGGQRQRVAVARAIVMEPAVLLMDEPLSNLDALLRLNFRAELKKLVAELETTTIYVTHDQVEALSLGDRIAVMRAGKVVQCDTPSRVYDSPATRFVGGFIGSPPMNFLSGRVRADAGQVRVAIGEQTLDAPAHVGELAGEEVLVGIRAEAIEASGEPAPGAMAARADVVEPLGSHLMVTVSIEGQSAKILTRTDFPARVNEPLWLRPEAEKLRWYHPDSGDELAAEPSGRTAVAG